MLSRDQTEPRGQVTPILELGAIAESAPLGLSSTPLVRFPRSEVASWCRSLTSLRDVGGSPSAKPQGRRWSSRRLAGRLPEPAGPPPPLPPAGAARAVADAPGVGPRGPARAPPRSRPQVGPRSSFLRNNFSISLIILASPRGGDATIAQIHETIEFACHCGPQVGQKQWEQRWINGRDGEGHTATPC